MSNKIKILILLIVLGVGGAAVGYFMYNKPHENIEDKSADFTLSADELMQEFESDEKSASEKYNGKLLEVSGKVETVNFSNNNNITILFVNESMSMGNVKAGVQSEAIGDARELQAGDQIKVKGRLTGINKMDEMGIDLIDIELSRCVVLK